jgi:hypothetical protein
MSKQRPTAVVADECLWDGSHRRLRTIQASGDFGKLVSTRTADRVFELDHIAVLYLMLRLLEERTEVTVTDTEQAAHSEITNCRGIAAKGAVTLDEAARNRAEGRGGSTPLRVRESAGRSECVVESVVRDLASKLDACLA